jgi:hypothetical protein
MAVARPILFLGPEPCHISDILRDHRIGWQIRHGDVEGAVRVIRGILRTDPAELKEMGERAKQVIETGFSGATLSGEFCDILEKGVR